MNGLFITLEGIDGSGKSTQVLLLANRLREMGYAVLLTKEPGGTEIGKRIAEILLDCDNSHLAPKTEMFLFAADRAQHVEELIKPALNKGQIVISSRYLDSTFAYQSSGRGLPLDQTKTIMMIATENLLPDLTFILDLNPVLASKRLKGDRMEQEGLEFQKKVREGYLALAARDPERIKIVNADGSPPEIAEKVWHWTLKLLEKKQFLRQG